MWEVCWLTVFFVLPFLHSHRFIRLPIFDCHANSANWLMLTLIKVQRWRIIETIPREKRVCRLGVEIYWDQASKGTQTKIRLRFWNVFTWEWWVTKSRKPQQVRLTSDILSTMSRTTRVRITSGRRPLWGPLWSCSFVCPGRHRVAPPGRLVVSGRYCSRLSSSASLDPCVENRLLCDKENFPDELFCPILQMAILLLLAPYKCCPPWGLSMWSLNCRMGNVWSSWVCSNPFKPLHKKQELPGAFYFKNYFECFFLVPNLFVLACHCNWFPIFWFENAADANKNVQLLLAFPPTSERYYLVSCCSGLFVESVSPCSSNLPSKRTRIVWAVELGGPTCDLKKNVFLSAGCADIVSGACRTHRCIGRIFLSQNWTPNVGTRLIHGLQPDSRKIKAKWRVCLVLECDKNTGEYDMYLSMGGQHLDYPFPPSLSTNTTNKIFVDIVSLAWTWPPELPHLPGHHDPLLNFVIFGRACGIRVDKCRQARLFCFFFKFERRHSPIWEPFSSTPIRSIRTTLRCLFRRSECPFVFHNLIWSLVCRWTCPNLCPASQKTVFTLIGSKQTVWCNCKWTMRVQEFVLKTDPTFCCVRINCCLCWHHWVRPALRVCSGFVHQDKHWPLFTCA